MNRFLAAFSLFLSIVAVALLVAAQHAMPHSITVGDRSVRVMVSGRGSPSVVLETFGPAYLETWSRIQPEIARFAKVLSYDHPGYWGSEPGLKPRHARQLARELHETLGKAGLPPPYLLVGYSFGGPYIRVFADLYPKEICGMVLVDPAQEQFSGWLKKHFPEMNAVTASDRERQDEWGAQEQSLEQARQATLPVVPITLITAAEPGGILLQRLLPEWIQSHREWVSNYPGALHLITTNSNHGIFFSEPGLVVSAVHEMIQRVQGNKRPLTVAYP